jgi:hypothetical protein
VSGADDAPPPRERASQLGTEPRGPSDVGHGAPVVAPADPPPTPPGRPRSWWAGAAVALGCTALWLFAAARAREPDPATLGRTLEARSATLARALPVGTSLDSARAYLHARRLDFAQGAPAGEGATRGGSTLLLALPGGTVDGVVVPGTRVTLEFDARRRLVRQRVEPPTSRPSPTPPTP